MEAGANVSEHFILFTLAGTTYGLRSQDVQQMEMVEQFTRVPNAPSAVDGVVFVRGQVIPAVNLRARFGFDRIPYDVRTRLIVIRSGGRSVGLIVDSAREFVSIPSSAIQPPPEALSDLSGRYLEGIAAMEERLVMILDVEEVVRPEEAEAGAQEAHDARQREGD